jgi:predicted enzyme related to lactoylglutathione lyase
VARTLARVAHRAANSPDQPFWKCPLRRDSRREAVGVGDQSRVRQAVQECANRRKRTIIKEQNHLGREFVRLSGSPLGWPKGCLPKIMGTPAYSVGVIALPVSDVERALRFYVDQVGLTIDVDYSPNDAFRVVQLTPPGSSCSAQIGKGLTDAPAGSLRNVFLVVTDLEAARSRLLKRGWKSARSGTKRPLERGTEVSRPVSPGARGLCQLRQLLRSGWQYLGAAGTGLPQSVTRRE